MANRLTKVQTEIISEKLMDWGNLVFVGLAIGQLVPGIAPFRSVLFFLGIFGMIGAYATAYVLMRQRG